MKAARLRSELLARKGAAAPVPAANEPQPQAATRPRLAAVDRGPATTGRPEPDLKRDKFGRARLSVRLDPHRHLRLKLLAAHHRMSLQETVVAALDAYLGDEADQVNRGQCDCLHAPAGLLDGE